MRKSNTLYAKLLTLILVITMVAPMSLTYGFGGMPDMPDMPGPPDMPDIPSPPDIPDMPSPPDMPGPPDIPDIPSPPDMPSPPDIPGMPDMPSPPDMPGTPDKPGIPNMPDMPGMPTIPDMPTIPGGGTMPPMPKDGTIPPMPGMPGGATMPPDGTMPPMPNQPGGMMPEQFQNMTPEQIQSQMQNLSPEELMKQGMMSPEQMKQIQEGAMPPDMKAQMEKAGLTETQMKIMEQMQQGVPLTEAQMKEMQTIQTKMQSAAGVPENILPGMEMPGGFFVPTYAEGVLPVGMMMPEGMKVPENFKMPVGFEMPAGMTMENLIPKGFEMPPGMKLPTEMTGVKIGFNAASGTFTGSNGKAMDISKAIMPDMMKNQGMQFDIPTMLNGALAPVYIENMTGKANIPTANASIKSELKKIISVDLSAKNVDKNAFTSQFKALNINKLETLGKDTLENLYANVTPDKLDITDPLVQKQMDLVYQERNKALSISDINQKLAELNKGGSQVLSIDPDSLTTELANLEAMKAKGITDPAMAKKIDDAIAKTKDAQLSQTRLLAIRQQVTQLNAVKQELVVQSKEILTSVSKIGLDFTPVEQRDIEKEIAASSDGTVGDQQVKIKGLIEKYSAQLTGANGIDGDVALKLATLYEKSNDMTSAQDVLSKTLEENPNNDKVALELAGLYENSNNLSKAAEVLKGALNRDPLPQTQAKLAEVTREMGKPTEAKPLIESALVGLPKEAALYTEASNIYKAAKDTATVKTFIDGEKTALAVTPTVNKDNVVIAQAEALAQSLGGNTKYDGKTQKMTITEGKTTIVLTAGSKTAVVNGVNKAMETAPTVAKDGKLNASAQFIATSMQESFEYKADSKMMIIGGK